ncbi:MAG: hypothetical protein K2P85_01495 [Flavobacteriaceae bacterium]|nr:hypothetical protein [Flavobacteriaceae bacterium]
MRNFTSIKSKGYAFLFVLFFALLSFNVFVEITPAVSSNAGNNITLLSARDLNSRSFFNDIENHRSKFTTTNRGNQNFGFDMVCIHKILFSYMSIPIIITKLPLSETFKIIS